MRGASSFEAERDTGMLLAWQWISTRSSTWCGRGAPRSSSTASGRCPTRSSSACASSPSGAPNHKRSWPWRFALFTGQARAKLGEAFVTDLIAGGRPADDPKVLKTGTKYLRAPAILVVGSAIDESKRMTAENRDAVAAGIEHVLLGATAAGLSSFWSSPPLDDCPTARSLCDFETATQLVGVVYLGWPKGEVAVPARPLLHIAHVS